MPVDEFDGWLLYFEWEYEQEKKAHEKAKQDQRKNSGKKLAGGKGGNRITI